MIGIFPISAREKSSPVQGVIHHMSYAGIEAPHHPVHVNSLTGELHCLLISHGNPSSQVSRQCCSQIRLHRQAD